MKLNPIIAAISLCIFTTGCGSQLSIHGNSDLNGKPQTVSAIKMSDEMREASQVEECLVELRSGCDQIDTTGEVKADENRVFHVNSLVGGKLAADLVSLGDYVETKQPLATVENLEVLRISANYIHETHRKELEITQAQARLKLALANKTRLEKLFGERIAAEKDCLAAQTQWALEEANLQTAIHEKSHQKAEAKALLAAYGVNVEDIRDDEPIRFSPIVSPRGGFIVKKNITIGDVINSSEPLYVVADLSKVWLDITIFDRDLSVVREGAAVKFRTDSVPQRQFTGKIDYIKPIAQDGRTFVARAIMENAKLRLKPGMFGRVEISRKIDGKEPFVPAAAIQCMNGQNVVFVSSTNGTYRCVPVQLGRRFEDGYFVSGLKSGQHVVTKGSYYVRELLANHSNKVESP